jgi:hypothetical protein
MSDATKHAWGRMTVILKNGDQKFSIIPST